jgi:hypothetical protein
MRGDADTIERQTFLRQEHIYYRKKAFRKRGNTDTTEKPVFQGIIISINFLSCRSLSEGKKRE